MEEGGSGVFGGTGATVMTDEQIEMLRKQIAIYASIVKQLLQKHRELCAHQDLSSSVMPLGIPYSHPLLPPSGHKIPSRQRWSPKPEQLQILERAFEQSNASPSKEKIKKLTAELAQHGQVAESNVYNWFQNRRARCKRKQSSLAPTSNNAEPQLRTQIVESSQEKKTKKPEDTQPEVGSPTLYDHLYNPDPDIGLDQVMGNKLDAPTGLSPYWNMKQNDMYG